MVKKSLLAGPVLVWLFAACPLFGQAVAEEIPDAEVIWQEGGAAAPGPKTTGEKPIVYLTFDDGPSSDEVTGRLLDVLASYNVKVTFFVTGARAKAHPEMIGRIVDEGHALGNHTLSHRNLTTISSGAVVDELSRTSSFMYAAGAPTINCFRAPFGETDSRVDGIAAQMGMRSVGWNIDTRDWDSSVDSDYLKLQLASSFHKSTVLMHDGPVGRWRTLAIFSNWMRDASELYEFKVLPACVEPYSPTYASDDSLLHATAEVVLTVGEFNDGSVLQASYIEQLPAEQQAELVDELQVEPIDKPEVEPIDKPEVELVVASAPEPEVTITEIITKMRAYNFELDPEVVAQTESESTTF